MSGQLALISALLCLQAPVSRELTPQEQRTLRIAMNTIKSRETTTSDKRDAAVKIGALGPRAASAGPELCDFLRWNGFIDGTNARQGNVQLAYDVAFTLGQLGPEASMEVAPQLLAGFVAKRAGDDPDPRQQFRDWLAKPLALMLPDSEELARAFSSKLADHDLGDEQMEAVLSAVRMLRPAARRLALPGVDACVVRTDCRVHASHVIDALVSIGPDAVPAIVKGALRGEGLYRDNYCEALGRLGTAGERAVPFLETLLLDQREAKRRIAAAALAKIGPGAASAAPALIDALEDSDYTVRCTAADALGAVGVTSPEVIGALTRASSGKDATLKQRSLLALAVLRKSSRTAVVAPDRTGPPLPPGVGR